MSLAKVFCSWSIAAVLLLISIAFSSSAESEKNVEPIVTGLDENGEEVNATTNVTLTGNPQIDYVHDPNLPRELNGYNLSDYPFFSRVPKSINFSCDGRKDGFYANVEHKCQVYHHCLYESRSDFLCANYTAFDQRTFICQFVSETDCPNSHMFFHRNKDLYITKTTTTIAPVYDRGLYERRRPQKKPKSRLRPAAADEGEPDPLQRPTTADPYAPAPTTTPPPPPKRKDVDYADEEYYDDDDYGDYAVRRPARPRRRFRKCRNGRRRGRRCRGRRPAPVYDYDDDYAYDDDYDYAYYDSSRPRKPGGKKRRPQNAIPAGTSQVTSTSSSETPAPTSTTSSTTTTTTTTASPTTTTEAQTGAFDSESVTFLENKRDELLTKTRRPSPFLRPGFRPSRQNDKSRTTSTSTTTSTTTTTTERAKPTTTATTTTTTEVPQYIYDYEYYEDDTPVDTASSTTTTTTTAKPSYFRGKIRGGNSAAALLEKQRVQQSIQVRVTEDSGTNTNTIRRRDNSNVQTPTRVASLPPTTSTTTTTTTTPPSTQSPNRPSRFWQRKSTVKIVSTTATPTTTTTTAAPYYQDYQDYEDDVADPQPSVQPQTAPAAPLQQSSKFQPLLNPTHQYGTSPAVSQRPQSYAAASPSQPPSTSPRGHGSSGGSSLSSSSYARPNKPYTMQQYSQSSSSSSSSINNNNSNSNSNSNNNYNTNSYHRQRSPTPSVPKPEFISLVDEDYNNPYVSPVAVAPTSPSSTRLHGSSQGGASPGYHQHPIRFFEQQHQPPAFLFGAASEYNSPQFAFPPRNYPSPSNFQPYGHSTRRFSAHFV